MQSSNQQIVLPSAIRFVLFAMEAPQLHGDQVAALEPAGDQVAAPEPAGDQVAAGEHAAPVQKKPCTPSPSIAQRIIIEGGHLAKPRNYWIVSPDTLTTIEGKHFVKVNVTPKLSASFISFCGKDKSKFLSIVLEDLKVIRREATLRLAQEVHQQGLGRLCDADDDRLTAVASWSWSDRKRVRKAKDKKAVGSLAETVVLSLRAIGAAPATSMSVLPCLDLRNDIVFEISQPNLFWLVEATNHTASKIMGGSAEWNTAKRSWIACKTEDNVVCIRVACI